MTTPQDAIDHAYTSACQYDRPHYISGGGTVLTPPYVITTIQPSAYRSHYRIDPDGRLWHWRTPRIDGVKCEEIKGIEYEEIV
jgi:hypothetical protein